MQEIEVGLTMLVALNAKENGQESSEWQLFFIQTLIQSPTLLFFIWCLNLLTYQDPSYCFFHYYNNILHTKLSKRNTLNLADKEKKGTMGIYRKAVWNTPMLLKSE